MRLKLVVEEGGCFERARGAAGVGGDDAETGEAERFAETFGGAALPGVHGEERAAVGLGNGESFLNELVCDAAAVIRGEHEELGEFCTMVPIGAGFERDLQTADEARAVVGGEEQAFLFLYSVEDS